MTSSAARPAAVLISAPTTTGEGKPLTALINQISAAQTRVLTGQTAVDTAKSAVETSQHTLDTAVGQNVTLRDTQTTACADSSSGSSGGTPSDDCITAQANYEAFADSLTAATTDLKTKIGTEDDAVTTLENAIKALALLLQKLPAVAASSNGGGPNGGFGGGSGGGSGGGTPGGGTGSGTPGTGTGAGSPGGTPAAASRPVPDREVHRSAGRRRPTARVKRRLSRPAPANSLPTKQPSTRRMRNETSRSRISLRRL
jgi:hypothetical protein